MVLFCLLHKAVEGKRRQGNPGHRGRDSSRYICMIKQLNFFLDESGERRKRPEEGVLAIETHKGKQLTCNTTCFSNDLDL